jgi:hypothetical protein
LEIVLAFAPRLGRDRRVQHQAGIVQTWRNTTSSRRLQLRSGPYPPH